MTQISPERLQRTHWMTLRDRKSPEKNQEWKEINNYLKNEVATKRKKRDAIEYSRRITTPPADPTDPYNVAQREFVTALNTWLEFTHLTKGFQAALNLDAKNNDAFEKWIAISKKLMVILAATVVTFLAALTAAVAIDASTGLISGGGFAAAVIALFHAKILSIVASAAIGLTFAVGAGLLRYNTMKSGASKERIQKAKEDMKANQESGGTYESMKNSESGLIIAQNLKAYRHAMFWAMVAGFATSIGSFVGFGNSSGTEIFQQLGYSEGGSMASPEEVNTISRAWATVRETFVSIFAVMKLPAVVGTVQTGGSLSAPADLSTTTPRGGAVVPPAETGRTSGPAQAPTASASEPQRVGSAPAEAVDKPESKPPRLIANLGEFPFAGSPEEAFSDKGIEKAADWLASREGWSSAKKGAFIEWCKAHRTELIAAADPSYKGPLATELRGNDTVMDTMLDKNGAVDNVRVPEGTRAIVIVFPYTENGVQMTGKVTVPVECFNFSDPAGPDVPAVTPEAPPRATTYALTSQEMCIDGKEVKETFIITVRSLAPGQTWEQAIQEAVEKLRGKLPAGDGGIPINQDVAIVRVDLNGDGIPETTKQVNLKTGEITDFVIRPRSGGSINVTELPPHEQDLQTEGSNDGRTTVVDPTYSEQKGSLKNTPNPPHEWMIKDGRLQRVIPIGPNGEMLLTPESQNRLIYEHLRIFINHILQKDVIVDVGGGETGTDSVQPSADVVPSTSEKALNSWLQAPVDEWKNMSAEEMAQKYGMSKAEASRILESIPQYEARCREMGVSPEPKPGQTTISYLEDIFAVLTPDRR